MRRNKKQRKTARALNLDLFRDFSKGKNMFNGSAARKLVNNESKSQKLPDISELYHLFKRFNFLYFGGKLKDVRIEYSNRMTSAGSYTLDKRLIKISTRYHEIFPDEIEDTLKHEMIHIKHFYHDKKFKAEALRIGASLKAKSHPSLERPPKFLYVCPGCGQRYPRQKRMVMHSCGTCSANRRFDPRFKLKLVRSRGMMQNQV